MRNTTLCYLERGGSYLMLHRTKKEHDINEGKWIGVGGGMEEGESPEDGVRREVREETGYEMLSWRYRGVVTFVPDRGEGEYMHLFTCDRFSGEEIVCNEGDLAWVRREDVPSLPCWEGDRIFLRLLEQEHPFFSLKLVYTGDALSAAVLDGRPLPLPGA